MAAPILVFDLDGTLIDTAPDLLDSLNHCLRAARVPEAKAEEMRMLVGSGSRAMIARAFANHGRPLTESELDSLQALFLEHYAARMPGRSRPFPGVIEALARFRLTESELDSLQALFLEHYAARMPGRSRPFPGVIEALARFREAGFIAAVCTNKLEHLSRKLIGELELDGAFEVICGADTFPYRKPDPRHLTDTILRAGGDPERALMIGDSRTDIDTAKTAGIPVVAVDFGYTDQPVHVFEPDRIISHFDELTVDLAESLIAAAAGQPASHAM